MPALRHNHVIGGVAMLAVAAFGLVIYAWFQGPGAGSEIFRFISLLIVFMAALAFTATVFFGLNLANAQEAFGLPTGSIRALLALGIMILFVVFGLPLTATPADAPLRVADKPIGTSLVPPALLEPEIAAYRRQDLVVIVGDRGRPVGANAAADPGAPARIDVYQKVRSRPAEELEVARQMLTAIVTLLTTIIGFYFGSRSVSEGLREAESARGAMASTGDLLTERTKVEQALTALQSRVAAASSALSERRGDPKTAQHAGIAGADQLRTDAEGAVTEAAKALAAADAALAGLARARSPGERTQAESVVRDQLQLARTRITASAAGQADFEAQVKAIQ